jgi:dGTPase
MKYERQPELPMSEEELAAVEYLKEAENDSPFELDPEQPKVIPDDRLQSARDRDRILYSSAFRRLSGVTQVISPSGRHPTHNRLTHTLEVAQIGKSIAKRLVNHPSLGYDYENNKERLDTFGGLDPTVVEAAALAHDLGHPPFGHVAETVLNEQVSKAYTPCGGFEGNAQSFRILTELSVKHSTLRGLNLTRGTLSAVSKYPWTRHQNTKKQGKWGAYPTESVPLDWSREHLPAELRRGRPNTTDGENQSFDRDIRTLEAQIMDWADDVAYAVHDLEDFYRVGVVPFDRVHIDQKEMERALQSHFDKRGISENQAEQQRSQQALKWIVDQGYFRGPYIGTREDRAALRSFTSSMVALCIQNASVQIDDTLGPRLVLPEFLERVITLLKDILWHYVIDGKALSAQRIGQRAIIEKLFDALCVVGAEKIDMPTGKVTEKFKEALHLYPTFNLELIDLSGRDDAMIVRSAADVISGLTEAQAVDMYQRVTGHTLGSALDPIIG